MTDYTSNILKFDGRNKVIFLPCILRLTINSLVSVSLPDSSATFNCEIDLIVYYGNLHSLLDLREDSINVQDFMSNLSLEFNRQETLKLTEQNCALIRFYHQDKQVQFIIQKKFELALQGSPVWTPFQVMDSYLRVTIHSKPYQLNNSYVKIYFNIMNLEQALTIIDESSYNKFSPFNIAKNLLQVKTTNSKAEPFEPLYFVRCSICQGLQNRLIAPTIEQQQQDTQTCKCLTCSISSCCRQIFCCCKQDPIESQQIPTSERMYGREVLRLGTVQREIIASPFKHGHFRVPIFRSPVGGILMIFIPIWMLGAITIFIFFQERSLGNRLGVIATLVLAHVALIPSINEHFTPSRGCKVYEGIILFQLISQFMLMVSSMVFQYEVNPKSYYDLIFNEKILLITVIAINGIGFVLVMLMIINYRCCRRPEYTKFTKQSIKKRQRNNINRNTWRNEECNKQFRKIYDFQQIRKNCHSNLQYYLIKNKNSPENNPEQRPQNIHS